jgi:hypothetical protein
VHRRRAKPTRSREKTTVIALCWTDSLAIESDTERMPHSHYCVNGAAGVPRAMIPRAALVLLFWFFSSSHAPGVWAFRSSSTSTQFAHTKGSRIRRSNGGASSSSTTTSLRADFTWRDTPAQLWDHLVQDSNLQLPDISSRLPTTIPPLDVSVLAQRLQQGTTDLAHAVSETRASAAFVLPSSIADAVAPLLQSSSPAATAVVAAWQSSVATWPVEVQVSVAALVTFSLVTTILNQGESSTPPPGSPYPMNKYDAESARRYFARRPMQVLARGLEIAIRSTQFALSVLLDREGGRDEERGRELAVLLTTLGPTFIKVGQSLSIRTDLLSPGYIKGLTSLQDQVPAFDTAIAQQIIEDEWGKPISAVLEGELSAKPIAAASLGQVYKAKLRSNGQDVAIKVQRPDIMEKIALDMHLLREFGSLAKKLFAWINTDLVGTVDAWAQGFVDELDYIQEAANGEFFVERIKETPLKDVVFTPAIVHDHTTNAVLVTTWVDGQRLDESSNADVSALCSIAMNTYLTMLLELGVLRKFLSWLLLSLC